MKAAMRLHQYLVSRHWNGNALIGPDVGIRLNYRFGRFIKGYIPRINWNDDYFYVQGQGYWILANWQLFLNTREERFHRMAVCCSDYLLTQQRKDGAWIYPNPEWHGRIATAEGTWGSLGLLESYRRTGDAKFLASAIAWHEFMVQKIGFQQAGTELAVNYFCGRTGARVPNNSAFVLRFLAELWAITRQASYLTHCRGLLKFLQSAQCGTGEFPYAIEGKSSGKRRQHFQCYQYNAFQCLDLMRYYELTEDPAALPLIERTLSFLRHGLAEDGHAFFDCGNGNREVTYHTGVLAQAFARARQVGIEGYDSFADRAYTYLLTSQRPDGGFVFSRGDYSLFSDRRSYPRNLAMILYHLLPAAASSPLQITPAN
jgi:uncharacterized protein YyaL (SSP411 family)